MEKEETFERLIWKLTEVSWKLQAIGFLVSNQNEETALREEVCLGLGQLIESLGSRVKVLSGKLEEKAFKNGCSQNEENS